MRLARTIAVSATLALITMGTGTGIASAASAHGTHGTPATPATCKTTTTDTSGSTTSYTYTEHESRYTCTGHGYIEHMVKNEVYFSGRTEIETLVKDDMTSYPQFTSYETLRVVSSATGQ